MRETGEIPDLAHLSLAELAACHECDLLMRRPRLKAGERALCPRCGYLLFVNRHDVVGRSLALVLAALLFYVPANFLPIMQLNLLGQSTHDTVWTGVLALHRTGMTAVAMLVFMCSMAIPLLKLLCQLFVLLSIRWQRGRGYGLFLFRTYQHMREWGMLEVYMMGILVSIVKIAGMADLQLGFGLACFVGLLLVQVLLEVCMAPQQIWEALSVEHADARD